MYKNILIVRFINIKSVCFYIYVIVVLYKYMTKQIEIYGISRCYLFDCFVHFLLLFANPGTEKEAKKQTSK